MAEHPGRKIPANSYIKNIPVTKTLAELIAEVNAAGWLVSNLFQIGKAGFWRANLQHIARTTAGAATFSHEFADGWTAEEALTAAIICMRQKRNKATFGVKSISQEELFGARVEHHTGFALDETSEPFRLNKLALENLRVAFVEFAKQFPQPEPGDDL